MAERGPSDCSYLTPSEHQQEMVHLPYIASTLAMGDLERSRGDNLLTTLQEHKQEVVPSASSTSAVAMEAVKWTAVK